MYKIGIIGLGSRMCGVLRNLPQHEDFEIGAVCDPDRKGAAEKLEELGYKCDKFYDDAKEMLDNEKLDGVCIGTRCSTHTEFAVLAAKYNIPIFLEKPVSTTEEDMKRLEEIVDEVSDRVVVSFPLRTCAVATAVKEIVDSGKLGRIEHVQAVNNVPYGRGYYHKWYRDDSITGGLFLQKSTHDFDYINYILGDNKPVSVCAMASKQIFKGDMPAGLKCADCDKRKECPESDINVAGYGDKYLIGEYCCFAEDTGNEDSGSAIVRYESGMHVVYSQNFIARKGAKKRGARFIGYLGTLEFDFYTGEIKVWYHNEGREETHRITGEGSHHGGDDFLVKNFTDIVRGKDVSRASLQDGILSVKMCLAAKKSSEENKFYNI